MESKIPTAKEMIEELKEYLFASALVTNLSGQIDDNVKQMKYEQAAKLVRQREKIIKGMNSLAIMKKCIKTLESLKHGN
jgi:excinuclease UvrABC nuclease subunit